MDREQLLGILIPAIQEAISEEADLLNKGRVEENFTGQLKDRIAPRVSVVFPPDSGIRVECFYNKLGDLPKNLEPGDTHGSTADLVIHRRGAEGPNLLVLELETRNDPSQDDIHKLIKMTKRRDQGGWFGYEHGLYLAFGVEARTGEILIERWFENSIEIDIGQPISQSLMEVGL